MLLGRSSSIRFEVVGLVVMYEMLVERDNSKIRNDAGRDYCCSCTKGLWALGGGTMQGARSHEGANSPLSSPLLLPQS